MYYSRSFPEIDRGICNPLYGRYQKIATNCIIVFVNIFQMYVAKGLDSEW